MRPTLMAALLAAWWQSVLFACARVLSLFALFVTRFTHSLTSVLPLYSLSSISISLSLYILSLLVLSIHSLAYLPPLVLVGPG